jgi:CRP/FNR family cyclic AMP-dependent transcriptional regulator
MSPNCPFWLAGSPVEGNAQPLRRPDLVIEDEEPLVSDLGSTLGTMVNGRAIGHHFMTDAESLHRGENHVVAGGWGSPFEFLVSIGIHKLDSRRYPQVMQRSGAEFS